MNMKLWKAITIVISIVPLILISTTASSAVVSKLDGIEDIYHQTISGNVTSLEFDQERPDIDIMKVSYYITEDSKVKVMMVINGFIKDSNDISYVLWYNTTNASYWVNYSNGTNNGWMTSLDNGEQFTEIENVDVSSHILTVAYGLYDNNTKAVELWGYACEKYINGSNMEKWIDYVPDRFSPYSKEKNGDNKTLDNDGDDALGTPGFETITVLIAVAITLIILGKTSKKK